MPTLAIRASDWNALSRRDQEIVRYMDSHLALGLHPAPFLDDSGVEQLVFEHHQFTPDHIARLGALMANLTEMPNDYEVPQKDILDRDGAPTGKQELDRDQVMADVEKFTEDAARTNKFVKPEDVIFADDDPNPLQTILKAQGAPDSIQAGSGVSEKWKPVDVQAAVIDREPVGEIGRVTP